MGKGSKLSLHPAPPSRQVFQGLIRTFHVGLCSCPGAGMEDRKPHQPSMSSYFTSFSLQLFPKQGGDLIPSLFPQKEPRC